MRVKPSWPVGCCPLVIIGDGTTTSKVPETSAVMADEFDDPIYSKATDLWGVESQIMLAAEECGELLAALSKYWRGGRPTNVAEEIADVLIVCRQLAHTFGAGEVRKAVGRKLTRLHLRVEEASHDAWMRR